MGRRAEVRSEGPRLFLGSAQNVPVEGNRGVTRRVGKKTEGTFLSVVGRRRVNFL